MFRFALPLCGVLLASTASAVPLSNLIAGDTLTSDDITVSGFSYTDDLAADAGAPGIVNVAASNMDVNFTSAGTTATLVFNFSPSAELFGPEELSILGGFNIESTARDFTNVAISLFSAGIGGDAAIEFALSQPSLINTIISSDTTVLNASAALAGASHALAWDIQASSFGVDSRAAIDTVTFDFTLDRELPPTPSVPVPAGLPLLLTGLCAVGWMKSRKA